MPKISSIAAPVLCFFTFLLATGCSTTGLEVGREAAYLDIQKGSPTEDLVAALGEPKSVKPYEGDPEHVQIWTYEYEKSHTEMVAYRSKEVPYVDPLTGEMKMILEPEYQTERRTSIDIVQIYVSDDKVLAWKVDRKQDRDLLE